jgi:hypothetical protein
MNKHGTNISSLTQTGSKSSTTIARLARGSFLIVFGFAMAGALVNPAYAKSWEKTKAERLGRPGARVTKRQKGRLCASGLPLQVANRHHLPQRRGILLPRQIIPMR